MADLIDSMHGEPNSTRLILHRNRYNEMGLLVGMEAIKELASEDAVEVAQPNLQPTCNQLATDCISRKAAIEIASGYCHPANIAEELERLPSVDAVEVVRCKYCRYWAEDEQYATIGFCRIWRREIKSREYCSEGRRKE